MMTFKNLRYGLSSSVVLAASLFSVLSYAATDSIGLTVITTVEMGTCTATLVNDSDQDISVVDFGDVYISEINAKTKVKTFKLKFKDCAGIPNKKAQIKLTKRATCEGTANDGAGFANGSTAADKASTPRRERGEICMGTPFVMRARTCKTADSRNRLH